MRSQIAKQLLAILLLLINYDVITADDETQNLPAVKNEGIVNNFEKLKFILSHKFKCLLYKLYFN